MRKWLVVLMAAVAIGATAILGWLYVGQDRKGPEITIADSKKDSYTADMTTEDLLEGVKAVDEKDGDVSDSLTVENVYSNEKGDEVTVVYVAKDKSNNVTKVTYHMTSDGVLPGSVISGDEASDNKSSSAKTNSDSEDSEDLQDSSDEALEEDSEEDAELTEEEKAQEREEAKIDKLNPQDPRFYLTTYYVEITKGTQIDRLSYVKDIQDDKDASNELYRKIQITGNVDVNTPGTYELTYYVVDSNGNASNGAVLTIVVK
nr:immunoglobulin-like domain-containing protein [uncultured Blautia sp.]